MKLKLIAFIFLVLTSIGCEKKKYCIYGRTDLRNEYILRHPIRDAISYSLKYDFTDPKNVFWVMENRRKLDSLISVEGYNIDTSSTLQSGSYTIRIAIDGDCQYCDYYKSINPRNYCEPYKE
jgi:hypothetical protein